MVSSKNVFIATCLIFCTACNRYLDVKPKEHYLQEKVFRDEGTIELARRGIYTALSADELYGGTLTMGALDVMGQYYQYPENQVGSDNVTRRHNMYGIGRYDYTDSYAAKTFASTWKAAYTVILNINSFIVGLKNAPGILNEADYNLRLGEAYGLRAYVHFDLLRIFGPVYRDEPDGPAIPYHVVPTPKVQPILAASVVSKLVLADLDSAASFLSEDSIRKSMLQDGGVDRFNYFAAMASYARVCLYLGDRERAAHYAAIVLEEGAAIFSLSADGLLGPEVIYALTVDNLPALYQRYFAPTQRLDLLLSPVPAVLATVYGGNVMDVRYRNNWKYYPRDGNRIDAFQKYAPPAATVPLLRLSELYFIMAECAKNEDQAFSYLQMVASHRNELLLDGVSLSDALHNSYRRELWGEGQLFYYYKRMAKENIPSGDNLNQVLTMDRQKYRVPLPKAESIYR